MLQAISDGIRNSRWLGYLIVGVISVPFALWGIQAYFTGGGPQDVAEVNGHPISIQALDRQVGERRQQVREQFGGELPEDFSDDRLRREVLNDLINRELLRQVASNLNMVSSDERVAELIRSQEFFQRNGRFDPELYRQLLARSGIQPSEYEADMRRSDRLQQIQDGLLGSGFVLPSEVRHIATLEAQERTVSVVRIPREAARDRVSVDDDEIRAFHEDHQERFQTPRKLRVAYIELDRDRLAEDVDVTDEEIRAEFERRVAQAEADEEREAAHILIELPTDATDEDEEEARQLLERLRGEIAEGADFGALAEEYSDDLGSADRGGDLGRIERGDMVAGFDEALFALGNEGDISEPVRTRFGYHLIRLNAIVGDEGPRLDDLRDEIRADLQRRQAEEFFFDRVDEMVNAAYENPGSLEPAAAASGLEVQESDWFSREEGEGIARHQAIRVAAFDDEVRAGGRNSDVIELGDRHVAVIRMIEEREPEPIPLAEVEDEVREELRSARAAEIREQWLTTLREELAAGVDPGEIADRGEPPITIDGPHRVRFDDEAEILDGRIREVAFDLSVPEDADARTVGSVSLGEDEEALVLLHSVDYPEPASEHMAQFEFLLQRLLSNAEFDAWVAKLRADADIEINERRLRRGADG